MANACKLLDWVKRGLVGQQGRGRSPKLIVQVTATSCECDTSQGIGSSRFHVEFMEHFS